MQEKLGKVVFEAIANEAKNLTMGEMIALRSAWVGKLPWDMLPAKLREAFVRVGIEAGEQYNPR